ncbi:hypothetical protein LINPERHAP1_LOCUS7571 [Linum perenne]
MSSWSPRTSALTWRPDSPSCTRKRCLGLVTMGISYTSPGPGASAIMALLPEGFYARRWMVRRRFNHLGLN